MSDTMTARPLDGRHLAAELRSDLQARVKRLRDCGVRPVLGAFIIGDDPASLAYIDTIRRSAERCGIEVILLQHEASISATDLRNSLIAANQDPKIHGIIIQQPLPSHLRMADIALALAPHKDVDGATPLVQGLLALQSSPPFTPATPLAVMLLLAKSRAWPLLGRRAVVIGKSSVVGMPVALLLLHEGATVTVTHRDTVDLARHVRDAEIVVAAAGVPGLITGSMLRSGAVVIDVGTTVVNDRLLGDVDAASAALIAGELTPVPGGVGPVTTVALLRNVVAAAERQTPPAL